MAGRRDACDLRSDLRAARRRAGAAHRGGCGPRGARARRARRAAHGVPFLDRRDRSRHFVAVGSREFAGFIVAGLPAGGSVYLALATVSIVPVCAGAGALGKPAHADAEDGAGVGRRGPRRVVSAAGDRRHRERRRLAALGDAAWMGGAAAPVRRRAAARAAPPGRERRAAALVGRADQRRPRHRHRGAAGTRPRRAAPWAAVFADWRRRCAPSAAA